MLAIAALAVAAVGLSGASGATRQLGRFHNTFAGGTITGSTSRLALSNKMTTYILELRAKPVAAVDAASKAAGRGSLSFAERASLTEQIQSQQAPVVAAVRQLHGAYVTERYQGVYNGIAVSLPQSEAWKLSSISGVKAVFASKTLKMADAPGDGVPLVNGPQAWGGVNGFTGTGMKIADIDTGIDYTHADFGGTGTKAAYTCALAHDTEDAATLATSCPGVSNWVSGPKIKGGTDLVGDAYNSSATLPDGTPDPAHTTPHPDSNPLDCSASGHGTHTAGTASGFGVDSNGNTYTGAYNQNTINSNSFIIPPGVAPQATLYSVRVFGCGQSTTSDAVLISAMDWAFNNGMDAVNMSIGASFGSPTDPDSVAATNLAANGVIIVNSSGNSGPNPYTTGSPDSGTGTLAVAANDSTVSFPAADLTLSTGGNAIKALVANGVTLTPGTYTLKVIYKDPPANTTISLGCRNPDGSNPDGADNSLPPNTIIVVARGTCARVAKAIFAQQAGAAGVIMVNNSAAFPPYEGPITSDPDAAGPPLFGGFQYTVTIPFLGVPGGGTPSTSANGAALRAADGGTVQIAGNTIANPGYLGLASFTSFGPSAGGLLKPEVTGPGVSIISAGVGKGNGGAFLSGTSMAAPHATGTAALVKQAHPNWGSVALWKAAIVNTANPALVANYDIRGAGAGEIDAYKATHTSVVALGDPTDTASLSYGVQDVTKKFDLTRTITLHNMSTSAATFTVSSILPQGVGHKVIITTPNSNSPSKVRVPAHGTATVTVELIVYRDRSADPVRTYQDWWGSAKFDDAGGLIHFAPFHGSNRSIALNVPYYAVPTAVSSVQISGISSAALKNGATDNNVVLTNPKSAAGWADWFAWGGSSPVSATDIGSADLVHDGIQSFPTGNNNSSVVVFALQTTKSWTNPSEDQFNVLVDVNGDSTPDYLVTSVDRGLFTQGNTDGHPSVFVVGLATGTFVSHFVPGAMFNGTTMELPAFFSDLCQAGNPCISSTPITYQVFSFDRNGGADQITNNAPFDVFHPSVLTASGGEDFVDRSATVTDPVTIDQAAWSANPQLGILVLMQNNQNTVGEAKTFALSF